MSVASRPPVTANSGSTTLNPDDFPITHESSHIRVALTYSQILVDQVLAFTRSPQAGANVLFLGTTRNNFDSRPVARLSYQAYPALALKSFYEIAAQIKTKHELEKVCLVHRLGEVGIEEESIAICVSAGHRGPAWRGAEEALEECKKRVEIWKMEWFDDAVESEPERGVWRANVERDSEGNPASVDTS